MLTPRVHQGCILEFTGMTGRSYTALGSPDMKNWTPLTFRIPADGADGGLHSYYFSPNISTVQVQALQPSTGPTMTFFQFRLE